MSDSGSPAPAPTPASPPEREVLLAVFAVAFAMMLFEMTFFQVVQLVSHYLLAVYSIAIALMGLIAGGVLAYALRERLRRVPQRLFWIPLAVAGAVGLSLLDVLWLHTVDRLYFFACAFLVYLGSGLFLSHVFSRFDSYRVYGADMIGAGLGVVGVVWLVPALLEENTLLVSLALAVLAGCLLLPVRLRIRLLAGAGVLALLVAWLVLNRGGVVFNLVRDAAPNRFTNTTSLTRNLGDHRWLLSRSSVSGRLDFAAPFQGTAPGAAVYDIPENPLGIRVPNITTFLNNRALDGVDVVPPADSVPDIRVPGVLHRHRPPRILIVGAAAQGVTKPVSVLGGGRAAAVEINPATVEVMTGELAAYSRGAYAGLDLFRGDVRTLWKVRDERYDIITLLNTHNFYIGQDPIPDYPFTLEAIREAFDHLADGGFIDLEEMVDRGLARQALQREVANYLRVLGERGECPEPAHCLYAYRWRKPNYPADWWFIQVLIGRRPFAPEAVAALDGWVASLAGEQLVTEVLFTAGDGRVADELIRAALDVAAFEPLTDDRPFNQAAFLGEVQQALNGMTVVLALLGLAVLAWPTRRFLAAPGGGRGAPAAILYFVASGFGYMWFEMVAFQQNHLYLGSPGVSLVVAIAAMLVASGLGGWVAGRLRPAAQRWCLGLVPLAIAALGLGFGPLLDLRALWFESLAGRSVLCALLLSPPAFLMGVPFAAGLAAVRRRVGDDFAAYLFALNGVAASLGAVLSFNLSLRAGFGAVLWVAIGLYGVVFAASWWVLPRRDA